MLRLELDGGGYVELVGHHASDLLVVNGARASFDKQKSELDDGDRHLIKYLVKHKHMAPFRHPQFTFRIKTSEVTMRQMYKHQIGCGWTSGDVREAATVWSEVSGRYTVDDEYEIPASFRPQHENNRQASVEGAEIARNSEAVELFKNTVKQAHDAYTALLAMGVCKEQARMIKPVCFMTTVVWTASLEAVVHFIRLRDHDGAQVEIKNLARCLSQLVRPIVPVTFAALFDNGNITIG